MFFDILNNRVEYNSFSVVFLMFMYSIATLPSLWMPIGPLIIALSLIVIGPNILINLRNASGKFGYCLIFELFLLLVLLIENAAYPDYQEVINENTIYLLAIGTIGLFVGTFEFSINSAVKYGSPLAIICFITSLAFIFLSNFSFSLSMRFGYAMLPSTVWFLFMIFERKSIFYAFLFFISLLSLILFGSRGTLISIILFTIISTIGLKKKFPLVLFAFFIILHNQVIDFTIDILTSLSDMTGAKKISTLINLLANGTEGTVGGRDVMYEHCIDLFSDNIFGYGVGFWLKDPVMNGHFPHNIVLQIMTEFGIVGLLCLLFLAIVVIKKIPKCTGIYLRFYTFIVSIAIGRLMVSSVFWARPEFWLLIGLFLFNNSWNNIYKINKA